MCNCRNLVYNIGQNPLYFQVIGIAENKSQSQSHGEDVWFSSGCYIANGNTGNSGS